MSETIKYIIENISNLNEIDSNGNTLLLCLVYLNKIEDIKELLKYNPNIFHKNNNDFNVLTLSNYLKFYDINTILHEYIEKNSINYNTEENTLRKRTSSSNFLYNENMENNSNSSLSSSVSSISDDLL